MPSYNLKEALEADLEADARATCRALAATDLYWELQTVGARILNRDPHNELAALAHRAGCNLRSVLVMGGLRSHGWGRSLLADIRAAEALLS